MLSQNYLCIILLGVTILLLITTAYLTFKNKKENYDYNYCYDTMASNMQCTKFDVQPQFATTGKLYACYESQEKCLKGLNFSPY